MKKLLSVLVLSFTIVTSFGINLFADNYVPSIGVKKDVEIKGGGIKQVDENGIEHSATFNVDTTVVKEYKINETTGVREVVEGQTHVHEVTCISGQDPIDDCWVEIIVTPYILRDTIESNDSYHLINEAFDIVTTVPKIEELDPIEIKQAADRCDVDVDDLLVTDIFDITKYHRGIDGPEGTGVGDASDNQGHKEEWLHHGYVEVTLGLKSLKNFVCLLHYYDDGTGLDWHIVPSASVLQDGEHLYLSVDELSPFAVVVHEEEETIHGRDDNEKDRHKDEYYFPYAGVDGPELIKVNYCIWHYFILLDTIITFILMQFIRSKDEDDLDTCKKKYRRRIVITAISLLLSILFFVLGGCKWCIFALILELLVAIVATYYTKKQIKEDEE